MTKIMPIECGRVFTESFLAVEGKTSTNHVGVSSLSSASQGTLGSVFGLLLTPFKFVWKAVVGLGRIISSAFCCFCKAKSGRQILDWKVAKEQFSAIYTAVITSTGFVTDREKAFGKGLGDLSSAARERFFQHIGFAIAANERPSITDRAQQEAFYKEKCSPERIREYLGNIGNRVLKEGVQNFQKELEQKTKG